MIVFLLCDLLRLIPALRPAIAHHDIDLSELLLRLDEQALDLSRLGDVSLDGDGVGAAAEGLDDVDDFVGGGLGGLVVDDDGGAALAELDGAASADTATCAQLVR